MELKNEVWKVISVQRSAMKTDLLKLKYLVVNAVRSSKFIPVGTGTIQVIFALSLVLQNLAMEGKLRQEKLIAITIRNLFARLGIQRHTTVGVNPAWKETVTNALCVNLKIG
tara:strand:- start:2803 stop:3138 length:336 start_codon:yes stop_codon:yes gene_type:complete